MLNLAPMIARYFMLYLLFFGICLGLGYPILNRYDPRSTPGIKDVEAFASMVEGESLSGHGELRIVAHRKLIPLAARPFLYLLEGRVGSWDATLAALLIATSLFAAACALLVLLISQQLAGSFSTGLVAALLYLSNFAVPNYFLTGLVDSGEAFAFALLVFVLLRERWGWVPLVAVLGTLAKETFLPIASIFLLVWWWATDGPRSWNKFLVVISSIAAAGVTVAILLIGHHGEIGIRMPWDFASELRSDEPTPLFEALVNLISAHGPYFVFFWLVPFGLWRLNEFPRRWLFATGASLAVIVALGVYDDSRGNIDRALFSVAGPILSISAARLLLDFQNTGRSDRN
jgi:hypothetical protein